MNKAMINIDPATLAGGAFAAKLNQAIGQVIENIRDLNTEATEKREITMKLVFRADTSRKMVGMTIGTAVKLAPAESVGTALLIEDDPDDGEEITVSEYDGQITGQMRMGV